MRGTPLREHLSGCRGMTEMKATIRFFSTSLVLALVASATFALAQDRIQRSFDVASGGQLTVRAERASIEVHSEPGERLALEVVSRGGRDILDDYDVDFDQQGNNISLEIKSRGGTLSRWFSFGRRGLRVKAVVPTEYDVDLNTSGGSIAVDDLTGRVTGRTSGGSLKFARIEGPVDGRTSGGSIQVSEVSGTIDIDTSGGGIRIAEITGDVDAKTSGGSITAREVVGDLLLRTSGGGITVQGAAGTVDAKTSGGSVSASFTKQPDADCRLSTSGGSVTVYLDPDLSFEIDARAGGGGVRSDLPVTARGRQSKHTLQGTLNGGGPKLLLRTSGGSVRIRESKQ